jgi:hypothetical protein
MGSPKIGRPRSIDQQEQDRLQARLDKERAEATEECQPSQIELSAEEKSAEEREKRLLLEALRETRPAKPQPEKSAPETVSSRLITDWSERAPERIADLEPEPAPAVSEEEPVAQHFSADVAQLDDEINELEQQRLAALRMRDAGMVKVKETADTALAILARKRAEAEARRKEAAEDAAAQALHDRSRAAAKAALENQRREQASLQAQRAEFAQTFQPLIDRAKKTIEAIRALDKEHGKALRRLAELQAWADAPSVWPIPLRKKFQAVVLQARELVHFINNILVTGPANEHPVIYDAENALRTWTPKSMVAEITMHVSRLNEDTVRYAREQLAEVAEKYAAIEAEGKAYVATGNEPPEVIVLLPHEDRLAAKDYMKHRYDGSVLIHQTHAEGTIEGV